jgi:hypothetical protein
LASIVVPSINMIKPNWIIVLIAHFLEQRLDGVIVRFSHKNRTCDP